MARQPTPRQAAMDVALDDEALASANNALTTLSESTRALISTYNLKSANPDVLCVEIANFQASAVEAMFQIGVRLMVLRQVVPHGEWAERLEQMGMQTRTAQRVIQATMKYNDPRKIRSDKLLAQGKGKLLELLVLDDEDLDVLDAGGAVGELDLDEITKMSTTELRLKLREARADAEAKDQLIAAKDTKLNDLDIKLREAKRFKPNAESEARTLAEQKQLDEVAAAVRDAEVSLSRLMVVIADVMHESGNEALRGRALQGLQYVAKRLQEAGAEHGFDLSGGADGTPAWMA